MLEQRPSTRLRSRRRRLSNLEPGKTPAADSIQDPLSQGSLSLCACSRIYGALVRVPTDRQNLHRRRLVPPAKHSQITGTSTTVITCDVQSREPEYVHVTSMRSSHLWTLQGYTKSWSPTLDTDLGSSALSRADGPLLVHDHDLTGYSSLDRELPATTQASPAYYAAFNLHRGVLACVFSLTRS
ncbi:hypothetical protein FKP32DRAFT_504965 [Trametes sanguinea]|nr:hypothetical protein FKP32DRAFT_504965 [Trametes sanguinea]